MKQLFSMIGLLLVLPVCAQTPNYIFISGFEGTSTVYQYQLNGSSNSNYADIEGEDNGYDWVLDLDGDSTLGSFRIFYEEGDTSKSIAEIVKDPLDSNNNVLRYMITQPHISYVGGNGDTLQKGRIQAGINGNSNLREFYFQERMYLHPDLVALKSSPLEISWFTLQEFWNNGSNKPYPFRVTLNIQKPAGIGSNLFFGAHGQTKISQGQWNSKWEVLDTTYEVPLGEWLTFETYFLEGDSLNGRFKVTVTDSQNSTHEIVNIVGYTQHPDDPNPDGVANFNPMKLYTSGELIQGMNAQGASLSVYWDDFKIWIDSTLVNNLAEKENMTISYFPNPSKGQYTIIIDKSFMNGTVEIYNALNQKVLDGTINAEKILIDLSRFSSGIYTLKLYNMMKTQFQVGKLIKC